MSLNSEATEERIRGGRAALWRLAGPWWLFLVTGIAWLIIAWVVLRFTPASITTVGVLLGVLFLLAAVNEFLMGSMGHAWRWAHILLGIFFIVGAIWAFARPFNAFWSLLGLGAAAHLQGHPGHHQRHRHQGRQPLLVAWPGGRHPGAHPGVLGLAAGVPRAGRAPAALGRVLRVVPRHLRDRHRLRSPPPSARIADTHREGGG